MTSYVHLALLIAVALAAPRSTAVGLQAPCCSCIDDGSSCSACFYGIQNGSCQGYQSGSVRYCGCSAEASGAGCLRLDSWTAIMGAERRPNMEAKAHQLGGGLLNPGKRSDGTYNFEEWALVSSEGTILRASRLEFAERVHASVERFRPREKGGTSVTLVIEDAAHPSNSREIPLPKVGPIDIGAELPASLSGQEIWFRAEVGKDGVVDQVLLLNVPDDLVAGKFASDLNGINFSLRDALKLRYADEKRHRAVVFGLLRANLEGHLVMVKSRVLLPKCCCGASRGAGSSKPRSRG